MTIERDVPRAAVTSPLGLSADFVLALVVGVVLGGISWWADQVSWVSIPQASPEYIAFGVLQVFGNGPTLWLIGVFVVGLAARRISAGGILATASLLLAVAVYYGLIVLADTRPGSDLGPSALAWAAVAFLAGPPMGVAGRAGLAFDRPRPVDRCGGARWGHGRNRTVDPHGAGCRGRSHRRGRRGGRVACRGGAAVRWRSAGHGARGGCLGSTAARLRRGVESHSRLLSAVVSLLGRDRQPHIVVVDLESAAVTNELELAGFEDPAIVVPQNGDEHF